MKNKIIDTSSESREKLLKGVKQLADAVVATLGPNGWDNQLCIAVINPVICSIIAGSIESSGKVYQAQFDYFAKKRMGG